MVKHSDQASPSTTDMGTHQVHTDENVSHESSASPSNAENAQIRKSSSQWTAEADKELLFLVQKNKHNWKKIAKQFSSGRFSIVQLKSRLKKIYEHQPQKGIPFRCSEDIKIVKFHQEYGLDWDRISTHFDNRSSIMIKNRYYSHIKKKGLYEALAQKLDELEKAGIDVESLNNEVSISLNITPVESEPSQKSQTRQEDTRTKGFEE